MCVVQILVTSPSAVASPCIITTLTNTRRKTSQNYRTPKASSFQPYTTSTPPKGNTYMDTVDKSWYNSSGINNRVQVYWNMSFHTSTVTAAQRLRPRHNNQAGVEDGDTSMALPHICQMILLARGCKLLRLNLTSGIFWLQPHHWLLMSPLPMDSNSSFPFNHLSGLFYPEPNQWFLMVSLD